MIPSANAGWATTIYEADSLYHHIRVVDEYGTRTLRFDNSMETTMAIANPYIGHFEYIDYFFQSFCLNSEIDSTLMLGLGGASAPKLMQRYFPHVAIDIAEIDSMVFDVAREYFYFKPAENTNIFIGDARVFLKRSRKTYDLILMDAYTANKYGSFVPFHLATTEFFGIVDEHLSENGVFAFNVIGSLYGRDKKKVAAIYRTMAETFPNLYMFPARTSMNVVILASKNPVRMTFPKWTNAANTLSYGGVASLYPHFQKRVLSLSGKEPPNWKKAQLLTDDFAPIDGLLK